MESPCNKDLDDIRFYELWQIILKRKVLIFGLFLFAVILSATYSYLSPNIFRGYAIFNIITSELPDPISPREIANSLGKVDYEKRISIFPKTYFWVKEVQIRPIKDSKDKMIVTIDSKKMDKIPQALSEVLDYLNNLEFVRLHTRQKKEILQIKLDELSGLLESAPDYLKTYRKLLEAGKLSTFGFDLNKRIIETKTEVLQTEQKILKLNKGSLEVAVQPYVASKSVSPKTIKNIASAAILGLLLGIVLSFLLEYVGRVKNARRQSDNKGLVNQS